MIRSAITLTICIVFAAMIGCKSSSNPTGTTNVPYSKAPTGIMDLMVSDTSNYLTMVDFGTGKYSWELVSCKCPERTTDGLIVYVDNNGDLVESQPNGYGLRIIVKLHGDTVSSDHHADYFNNPRVSYDNTKIAYEGIGGRVYVVNRSNG